MRRRVFTLCSALSLLICAAVCALWVRGAGLHDNWTARWGGRAVQLTSGGGRLVLAWSKAGVPANPRALDRGGVVRWTVEPPFRWDDAEGNPLYARDRVPVLGLAHVTTPSASGVYAPHWLACLVSAALPAAWLAGRLRRQRRRAPPGLCRHCGYDLTGNVSGVCPECGTAVRAATEGAP